MLGSLIKATNGKDDVRQIYPVSPVTFRQTSPGRSLLRDDRRREAQGCRAAMPQTQISPGILNEPSLRRSKQFVSFFLKLLNRDLAAGVGLQVGIELIVLLHGGFPICAYTRAEFLKVHTDAVKGQAASAIGTFNSTQCQA